MIRECPQLSERRASLLTGIDGDGDFLSPGLLRKAMKLADGSEEMCGVGRGGEAALTWLSSTDSQIRKRRYVDEREGRHATKLGEVESCDLVIMFERGGGDQQIIGSDDGAVPLEQRPEGGVAPGYGQIVVYRLHQ